MVDTGKGTQSLGKHILMKLRLSQFSENTNRNSSLNGEQVASPALPLRDRVAQTSLLTKTVSDTRVFKLITPF